MKATRSKARQDVVNAAKRMPPLFHKLPNEDFDYRKSRTLWWLVKQPEVLKYIWIWSNSRGHWCMMTSHTNGTE